MKDDESDTTLSESLASTEVCSLTLDSNGEPASRKNLADLAGKRGLRYDEYCEGWRDRRRRRSYKFLDDVEPKPLVCFDRVVREVSERGRL